MYELRESDIINLSLKLSTDTRRKGNELFFKYCPYCNGGDKKDKETFSINTKTGMFKCFRSSCGEQGHFVRMARDFNYSLVEEKPLRSKKYKSLAQKKITVRGKAIEFMKSRGISEEVTKKYLITTQSQNENIIVFPFYDWNKRLCTVKYRKADFDKKRDKSKEWFEKDTMPILFGMAQCEDFTRLIITEGQIDSLSVAEAGIKNAVSVPNGARGFTWLDNCENWVNQFAEVVVFGDCEDGGITLVDELAKRLKAVVKAVEIADYRGEKDANDILRKYGKGAVKQAIEQAKSVPVNRIKKLSEVKAVDIYSMPRIFTRISELDSVIGGLYFGQVILLTGKRGDGKSTLMSQLICEALNQGYKTLVYSGELPDYHFKRWLDFQLAGSDNITVTDSGYYTIPQNVIDKINAWYDDKAYIYDNNSVELNGGDELESLLDIVEKAICRYGIQFVCIDNLMTAIDVSLNEDLYKAQSSFLRRLKQIAIRYNIVILLVAHPKKVQSNISNDDVSGSGDITNRVDTVIVYKRNNDGEEPYNSEIAVTKNRLIGKLALMGENSIKIVYSSSSKRLSSRLSPKKVYKYGWEVENNELTPEDEEEGDLPF